jgi:hypothetical protein
MILIAGNESEKTAIRRVLDATSMAPAVTSR